MRLRKRDNIIVHSLSPDLLFLALSRNAFALNELTCRTAVGDSLPLATPGCEEGREESLWRRS
jgi:hypothetical protein